VADAIQQIRWRSPDGAALEHCAIREGDTGVTLEGVAIPADAATALRYRIVADAGWGGLRSAHLTVVGGPTLALRHDGYGGWTDGEGKTRKELAGALDLFVDLTPITVMVMLRRLGGKPGKSVKLDAVKADLTTLSLNRLALDIICTAPGRYTVTPAGDATETIVLGDDGLLTAWDGRFLRHDTTNEAVAAAS
jgi:hypothetical protein